MKNKLALLAALGLGLGVLGGCQNNNEEPAEDAQQEEGMTKEETDEDMFPDNGKEEDSMDEESEDDMDQGAEDSEDDMEEDSEDGMEEDSEEDSNN